jgi:branched-chain amino acid transport system substrate-binding protein
MNRLIAVGAVLSSYLFACPGLAEDGPIKIGIAMGETGPFSNIYEPQKRAVEFAVKQVNDSGGIDGRPVELRFVDTESKPDVARKQIEKLALSGYNLIFGTGTSAEGLAVAPNLQRWNALLVSPISKSSKLIGEACQSRHFRTDQSDPSEMTVVKAWLQTRKETKWVTISSDFAYGHDSIEAFRRSAASVGKNVAESFFAALGTTDFAPYIQEIMNAEPEGVFVVLGGRDAVNFVTQAKQFGLLGKVTIAGMSYNQDVTISAVGKDAEGTWGNVDYSADIDTPENKAFVAAWVKAYGEEPNDYNGQDYAGISTLLQAIKKAHSADPGAVAAALSGGTFETPFGQALIRSEDHQMVLPQYIAHVEDVNGQARKIIKFSLDADKATPPPDPTCKMGAL